MKNELTRWDPFRELEEVHNRLSSVFESGFPRSRDREQSILTTAWAPLVDISEDDKSYQINVELPDMKREDIKVNVENGILTISGERLREEEQENRKFHRVERAYGSFVRNFTLPQNVDSNKVNATYRDGVLRVSIEKSESARPKAIEVKVD
jgi:HSP20 family protein